MYMYYSGKSEQFFSNPTLYGLMMNQTDTGGQQLALISGCRWMFDNGAYSGKFEPERWEKRLKRFLPFLDTCDGVVIPDSVVLDMRGEFVRGDWRGTLDKLRHYGPMVTQMGYPVAYALQDDHPLDEVPWSEFDVLFVAGSTEYKESVAAERIAKEAKRRGKRVHIGRVSQVRRMALTWWADSFDGTTFKWEPEVKHRRFDPILSGEKRLKRQWRLI